MSCAKKSAGGLRIGAGAGADHKAATTRQHGGHDDTGSDSNDGAQTTINNQPTSAVTMMTIEMYAATVATAMAVAELRAAAASWQERNIGNGGSISSSSAGVAAWQGCWPWLIKSGFLSVGYRNDVSSDSNLQANKILCP